MIHLKGSVVTTSPTLNHSERYTPEQRRSIHRRARALLERAATKPDVGINTQRDIHDPIIATMEMLRADAKEWGMLDAATAYGASQIRRWQNSIETRQRDAT